MKSMHIKLAYLFILDLFYEWLRFIIYMMYIYLKQCSLFKLFRCRNFLPFRWKTCSCHGDPHRVAGAGLPLRSVLRAGAVRPLQGGQQGKLCACGGAVCAHVRGRLPPAARHLPRREMSRWCQEEVVSPEAAQGFSGIRFSFSYYFQQHVHIQDASSCY